MKTQTINSWGPRSASYWMTAVVATGIIFLGARFMLDPQAGAEGFGITLASNKATLAYGWIKGIRDIFSGIVVLTFLISQNPRATAIAFGAAIIIPVSDCLTVLAVNGTADITHLLIHGITAVYMMITTFLLFKAKK
ncbi:hypothetical protein BEL04_22250 [Mucilaginibacter sp. PPCGB 2223]|uniref:DUF4267 domain-containing protein n=1 Tax=Mucilaginibacter sp. PPCGB 2223 TaxID=1886027 RepID=UPI000824262F|nr:DUF4267 domain-containing protein [Mucilaginibacter sp. PPCGB 2223]OCX50503.1 hypothetical protein BEL04_22250 [Mucilaginibacter sp. PPCGB 2223]